MQDYQTAVSELRSGRKESHWIWYIMPMMAGIGYSSMCQTYGVPSLDHATGYLLHPTLGPRLAEVVGVVYSQICERNLKLQRLMGSDVDALKAVSCLVLFRAAAEPLMSTEATVPFDVAKFRDQATLVLNAVATSYPACPFTTDYLKRQQTGKREASNHEDVAPSSGGGASQPKAQLPAGWALVEVGGGESRYYHVGSDTWSVEFPPCLQPNIPGMRRPFAREPRILISVK